MADGELERNLEQLVDKCRALEERIDLLESIIANVHDELHDPMSQYWCDKPAEDRKLLEALRDRVDRAMGWTLEEERAETKGRTEAKSGS